jgi:hypothetical protein
VTCAAATPQMAQRTDARKNLCMSMAFVLIRTKGLAAHVHS